ncbi:MAG: hypothetical protein ACLTBR_02970 [Anaerostipes sp.]|uniref:hypothetical protein n=1 Tax=Anaerostipes sp. TaxID=1872530 RepID=UPI0039911F25
MVEEQYFPAGCSISTGRLMTPNLTIRCDKNRDLFQKEYMCVFDFDKADESNKKEGVVSMIKFDKINVIIKRWADGEKEQKLKRAVAKLDDILSSDGDYMVLKTLVEKIYEIADIEVINGTYRRLLNTENLTDINDYVLRLYRVIVESETYDKIHVLFEEHNKEISDLEQEVKKLKEVCEVYVELGATDKLIGILEQKGVL